MVSAEYMKRALELAETARGKTRTNPLVGAVIVKDDHIIAEGRHRSFGSDHAEVEAIKLAGDLAADADLYVTLEPCNHFGKTPPCVEAVKSAGIKRVIAATVDPNPVVNGAGIRELQSAGVEVITGICEQEARRLNEVYFKHIVTGLPFVTIKIAQTLDGYIADTQSQSKWITSAEARNRVHQLRSQVDAVLIGANTARVDDPVLSSHGVGNDPLRIVLTNGGNLPQQLKLNDRNTGGRTMVVGTESGSTLQEKLRRLGKNGVTHMLVEGGSSVFTQFIDARLADKFIFVIAAKLLGAGIPAYHSLVSREIDKSLKLRFAQVEQIGGDLWIEAYPE
ncbi:MAG: bifunctional diaminohydroxyphosphoribosylaminopyrimidine deaminase/5-amino-6-(5-phosphoribosylamino)uracil reductase RibD [Candidatus Zixiibacteriota bacterium]